MLGRYVSGTLLILGVAMLMAPSAPEQVETEVARADTGDLSLARNPLPTPLPLEPEPEPEREPTLAAPQDPGLSAPDDAVDEAVRLALEPDKVILTVTGSRVNVRSGPSTNYAVISSVAAGDEVELMSYEGQSWARIRLPGGERVGFMARSFLAPADG